MLQDKMLDTTTDESHRAKNNNLLLLNNLDYGINFFIVAVALILGLITLFEHTALFLLGLCTFCLGVYQLISAIVGSLRGNTQKRSYLILALVYLMLLWVGIATLGDYISSDLEPILSALAIIVLPLGGAVYFTYLCYEAKINRS